MRPRGIALAGNMIVDSIKYIDAYPNKLELTPIRRIMRSLGGAVNNVGQDLARLDPTLPVPLLSRIGADENGDFMLDTLARYPSLDVSRVKREGLTSFTDVMTIESTGERTFFVYKGADSRFSDADIPFDTLPCRLLHIGYILLLDAMDAPDDACGTVMARALRKAQSAGILTSVDVVSEHGDRFRHLVPPALRYADYLTVNEYEAEQIVGFPLTENGKPHREALRRACAWLKEAGVRRWAVIHMPQMACGMDETGAYIEAPALQLPSGYIQGSVGAGDAFVAGLLYDAHEGRTLSQAMHTANAVAAWSLGVPTATDGVPAYADVESLYARYPLQPMA